MTQYLNVPSLDAFDPILHPLILALPVFLFATLVAILARLLRARKRRLARIREAEREASRKPPAQAPAAPLTLTSAPAAAAPAVTPLAPPPVVAPPVTPPLAAPPPQKRPATPADLIADLKSRISEAMKVQPNSTLAPLFLEMARHHKATGDESSYLAALRSAAGLAAQHGPRAAHAEARLQLAEAAFVAGDLTGACEQWQIARNALHDDGQKDAHARIDKRMRDNGCPTDWVLTDF